MLKITVTTGLLMTLFSCAPGAVYLDEDFGDVVKQNIALQTINPQGVAQDDSELMDGQKAQQAVERYRTGPAQAETESLIGSDVN